jgi:hypothetical protein
MLLLRFFEARFNSPRLLSSHAIDVVAQNILACQTSTTLARAIAARFDAFKVTQPILEARWIASR